MYPYAYKKECIEEIWILTQSIEKSFLMDPQITNNAIYRVLLTLMFHKLLITKLYLSIVNVKLISSSFKIFSLRDFWKPNQLKGSFANFELP